MYMPSSCHTIQLLLITNIITDDRSEIKKKKVNSSECKYFNFVNYEIDKRIRLRIDFDFVDKIWMILKGNQRVIVIIILFITTDFFKEK